MPPDLEFLPHQLINLFKRHNMHVKVYESLHAMQLSSERFEDILYSNTGQNKMERE